MLDLHHFSNYSLYSKFTARMNRIYNRIPDTFRISLKLNFKCFSVYNSAPIIIHNGTHQEITCLCLERYSSHC